MSATLQDIQQWLESAKKKGASHLIVALDTYDHSNYPVYVGHNENIEDEIERVESQNMQGIDEIYNMSMDIDEQLSETRVWNI
jgi:hypothetical protein